jgi:hypothetical protein
LRNSSPSSPCKKKRVVMASQLRNQTLVLAVVIIGVVTFGRVRTETQSAAGGLPQLTAQIATLQAAVNALQQQVSDQANVISSLKATVDDHTTKLQFVTVVGTDMYITGANVNIRDGSGSTTGGPVLVHGTQVNPTGLGNLIIGYNENPDLQVHTGSHNLVIGWGHTYTSVGGLVAGAQNWILGAYSSVTGGFDNAAIGGYSSVSGGETNRANGESSSIIGGFSNRADGHYSSVSGGVTNDAISAFSSVSGGSRNTASGSAASVSGGSFNTASGFAASVSGGQGNTASGGAASVSGGEVNTASGGAASVSGGSFIISSLDDSWAAGGLHQP